MYLCMLLLVIMEYLCGIALILFLEPGHCDIIFTSNIVFNFEHSLKLLVAALYIGIFSRQFAVIQCDFFIVANVTVGTHSLLQ